MEIVCYLNSVYPRIDLETKEDFLSTRWRLSQITQLMLIDRDFTRQQRDSHVLSEAFSSVTHVMF